MMLGFSIQNRIKRFVAYISMFLLLPVCCAAADVEFRSLVFDKGDGGSQYYRIPAIAVSPDDGVVVAVADRRWDSLQDLPAHIDVVARRSVDGGKTWSEIFDVALTDSTGGYGDPALCYDPSTGDFVCIMTHGAGLWDSTPEHHASIMVSRSSDGGITWTRPQEALDLAVIPGYVGGFASSGSICVLPSGRMMFVLVAREDVQNWRLGDYACLSDDGGFSWTVVRSCADNDGDEAKIVGLADGSLLMSIRNRWQGARKFSTGTDGGASWSAPWECQGMIEPGCNGDILRIGNRLYHTLPANSSKREDVTLYVSDDNANTWRPVKNLCPAPSAYSSMTAMPDGSLGILIEEGASDGGWRIWFTRLNIEDE